MCRDAEFDEPREREMAVNVEIKARVRDRPGTLRRIQDVSEGEPRRLLQEDTFFCVNKGRLKLRVLDPKHAQLIYYERSDGAGPRPSHYLLAEVEQPEELRTLLEAALGVRGVVRKTRWLYGVGQTRIHLDEVEGLGSFVELEVVLRPGQEEAEGRSVALALMDSLQVGEEDLVDVAYMDLLQASRSH
jgi:predicted adenylyl cyclase CyaB